MAGFQHNEIGNIHHVVDGAHTGAVKILPQPHGAGSYANVLDDPGNVPRAQVGGFHIHLHIIVHIAASFRHRDFRLVEGRAAGHSRFPSNAPYAQAVRPIGQHFKVHYGVVNAQNRLYIAANGILFLEFQNAGCTDGGIQLYRHA